MLRTDVVPFVTSDTKIGRYRRRPNWIPRISEDFYCYGRTYTHARSHSIYDFTEVRRYNNQTVSTKNLYFHLRSKLTWSRSKWPFLFFLFLETRGKADIVCRSFIVSLIGRLLEWVGVKTPTHRTHLRSKQPYNRPRGAFVCLKNVEIEAYLGDDSNTEIQHNKLWGSILTFVLKTAVRTESKEQKPNKTDERIELAKQRISWL